MAVQSIQVSSTGFVPNTSGLGVGQTQQSPTFIFINTNDTLATVLTSGYLNHAVSYFQTPLNNHQIALVYTTDAYAVWLSVSVTGTPGNYTYSLVGTTNVSTIYEASVGSAGAPSYTFVGRLTDGLYSAALHEVDVAINGSKVAAFTATGLAVTGALSTTTTIAAGTNITAGSSGTAGTVSSFPTTASRGSLVLAAVANTGNTITTISNAAMGQASVVSIPDPGAATANFLLDTGAANLLAMQEFVGLDAVLSFGTGTWTTTRAAEGNYYKAHSAAAETSIIGIDITPAIRTAASKGFRLDSFDVVYSIGTLAAVSNTVTLDRIAYADNVAVSVTSIPVTGTLATATQANPYVTNIAVTTPAFDNTAASKYVIEVTINNAATTVYNFYGIVLHFTQTIG